MALIKTRLTLLCSNRAMFRSLVALLLALAVALLPPAAAFAPINGGLAGDLPVMATAHDCCDDTDSCPAHSGCVDMSSCAAHCGTTLSALLADSRLAGPAAIRSIQPLARAAQLASVATAPPFRPPAISIRA